MIENKKPSDQRKRARARGKSHTEVLARNRVLAQLTNDTLADLSDLPITIVKRTDPQRLFQTLKTEDKFTSRRFSSQNDFQHFVSMANIDPFWVLDELRRDLQNWRPIFDKLQPMFFFTRPARSEPVLRLLRDHWTWRWLEILALLDATWHPNESTLSIYNKFADNVWLVRLVPLVDDKILLVGPIKNKDLPAQTSTELISTFIEKYSRTLVRPYPALYRSDRYEQFFYDRPSIYSFDLSERVDILVYAYRTATSLIWPRGHGVDHFDITACTELSYCIADVVLNPLATLFKLALREISLSFFYPLYIRINKSAIRRLRCIVGHEGPARLQFDEVIPSKPPLAIFTSETTTFKHEGLQRAFNSFLNRHFEEGTRRRRTAQSQRMLEELLLLRYRMADNFGILASDQGANNEFNENLESILGRRIARAAAEMCHADGAVIYRLDHLQGVLYSMGAYLDDPSSPVLTRDDYKWMEQAAHVPGDREKSVAYAAARDNCCICYNENVDFAPLARMKTTILNPPKYSSIPSGRSLVAIPIRVFGRLWGVCEVVSNRTNSFSYAQIEWLEKIADLIGPYYHEQVMINSLYHIAAPPSWPSHGPAQFDELARQIAGIFLCDTACVWLRDLFNTDQFTCVGFTGRPDLEVRRSEGRPSPTFTRNSPNSVGQDAIMRRLIWVSGRLGEPPFSGLWLDKEHTRSLQQLNYKHIAILPIYDLEANAIAVATIYSKDLPFLSNWEYWAKYISSYLGAMITRVHNVKEIELQDRRLVAHEIINAASTIKESIENISQSAKSISELGRLTSFRNWVSDIRKHTADIDEIISGWATSDTSKPSKRSNVMMLARAKERLRTEVVPELNFREEFRACISPLHRQLRRKKLEYDIEYGGAGLFLRMHPDDLRKILNNLIQNAIKYAPQGARIHCVVQPQSFSVRFSISNPGPVMEKGETLRAFDLGFRGSNSGSVRGTGVGLYVVRRLCELYEIAVSYDPRAEDSRVGQPPVAEHRISLDFPAKIVVQ